MEHLTKGIVDERGAVVKHRFALLFAGAIAVLAGACAQPGTGYFRNDLNDDIIARVKIGQKDADVRAILGAPYQLMRFNNLESTAWDYMYKDTWGYWVAYSIMINDNGRVVDKVARRIEPSDPN